MRRPKPSVPNGEDAVLAASVARQQTRDIRQKMIADATEALLSRNDAVRANIHDMALWFVVGLGSILTLAIGATSLSQLGGMDIGLRFVLALASLATGAGLCVKPLFQAIDLMTMSTYSRHDVYACRRFAAARGAVERAYLIENRSPENRTFAGLDAQLLAARDAADPETEEELLEQTLTYTNVVLKVREAMELAITTEMRQRLDTMLNTLREVVPWVVGAMGIFVWAANPPAPETETKVTPYAQAIAWKPEDEATLKAAGMSALCLRKAHPQLFVIATRGNQRLEVIAVHPEAGCPAVRTMLNNENRLIPAK